MTADADFFFRMGFFAMKDDDCESRLGGGVLLMSDLRPGVCSGPYSQVVSQSLSQFSDSGETVLRLYFDLIHVRQAAFSNLVLLLISFLRWTI